MMKLIIVLLAAFMVRLGAHDASAQVTPRGGFDEVRLGENDALYECEATFTSRSALEDIYGSGHVRGSDLPLVRTIQVTHRERATLSEYGVDLDCTPICEAFMGDYLLWCLRYCQGSPEFCPEKFCSSDCSEVEVINESICSSKVEGMTTRSCQILCTKSPSKCPSRLCTTACLGSKPPTGPDPDEPAPVVPGRCGPRFGNGECDYSLGECCSIHGWCGTTPAHCTPCAKNQYGPFCSDCPRCGLGSCNDGRDGDGGCTCRAGVTGDRCDHCESGYFGPKCAKCECGGGDCDDGDTGSGSCTCHDGFTGDKCDECVGADEFGPTCETCECPDNSVCNAGYHNDGGCPCTDGWEAPTCTSCSSGHYGEECRPCPNICGPHGQCEDGLDGDGSCKCDEGFAGARCDRCEEDHYGSDCSDCPECGEAGLCDDGIPGTGRCGCMPGWEGVLCTEEFDE